MITHANSYALQAYSPWDQAPIGSNAVYSEPWGQWIYPAEKGEWFYHPVRSLCSTSKVTFHRTFKQLSTIPGTDSRIKAEH